MDLYELNRLINCLINENDPNNNELIQFYKRKRVELVETIKHKLYVRVSRLLNRRC